MAIRLKRVYEQPAKDDGYRVLVDRLWPRGITKDEAKIDLWLKDIAPTHELRKWFDHDPKKWAEFQSRYVRELENRSEVLAQLVSKVKKGRVTLLFAAKDEHLNNAAVLKEYLEKRRKT